MRQYSVDGREDAGKGQATYEAPDRKPSEVVRNSLHNAEDAAQKERKIEDRTVAPSLTEHSPWRRGDHAGDAYD